MNIFPLIELSNGKCVSLNRGRLEEVAIWHVDPVETAHSYATGGAEWMHVTDIDMLTGEGENDALIEEIIRTVGIPVQLGGGFRTRERVEYWIDKGVGRVVIGTMAALDPALLRQLSNDYPDQIVLSVDIWQGQVMTNGWRTPGTFRPEDYVRAFDDVPLAGIIVTDIDADIEEQEAQLGVISGLAAGTRHPVIARGTVRNADDVARLKYVSNISGTLIGRALFSKDISLEEALSVARPDPEPTAEFL